MANRTKVYPEWVEKYRGPGRTIRQLKNGYALYHCSSRYRPGEHPLVQQTYLGMITEADGFIPKKAKGDKIRYLEYGLSHVIWRNFLPELRNAVNARNAKDNLVIMLGILRFIYGQVDAETFGESYLTILRREELTVLLGRLSPKSHNLEAVVRRLNELFSIRFPDAGEQAFVKASLLTCVIRQGTSGKPVPSEKLLQLLEKHHLTF